MNKFLKYILIAVILWFCIHISIIVIDGLNDELLSVDVGVVLGNKIELNGQPSKRLKGRLDRAVELYKDKYFKYIIVSGGVGKEGFNEAQKMKEYLIKTGVEENKIILDSNGYNTLMTARNSRVIMEEMNLNTVMIISQYYHITRTKLAFKKVGFDKVYSAHSKIFEIRDIYSLVREFFAYYKYLFIM